MYWQRVKRTILARFTLFFLRNPYPELAFLSGYSYTKPKVSLHIHAIFAGASVGSCRLSQ